MNKTEILLLIILLIPLVNCLAIRFYQNSDQILNFLITAAPILFLSSLAGLYQSFNYQEYNNIDFIRANSNLAISFFIDSSNLKFLFLFGFIWLIFSFYLRRFLQLNKEIKFNSVIQSFEFQMFFAILISLINFIITAKNLLTILFFYNCLIIWYHFFAVKFLYKKELKNSGTIICNFTLYLQSILLFLAIIITYKFSNHLEFNSKTTILANIENTNHYLALLLLYFASLFLLNLFCGYLLYRNINFSPLEIFIFFALGLGLVQIFIFDKLLTQIFGLTMFSAVIKAVTSQYFYYIFSFNMLLTAILAIFARNLKSSFFYLFFNQLIYALLVIFIFAQAKIDKIFMITINFLLSQLLVFFTLANIIIFLKQVKNKEITALFYKLKITTILMIFAFLNMIGIVPGLGLLEKFLLIKTLFDQQLSSPIIILTCNQLLLIIFAIRLFHPMFLKNNQNPNLEQQETSLAKDTDLDSGLILPPSIIALTLILLLFFIPK